VTLNLAPKPISSRIQNRGVWSAAAAPPEFRAAVSVKINEIERLTFAPDRENAVQENGRRSFLNHARDPERNP
jgi:hypothetical protein